MMMNNRTMTTTVGKTLLASASVAAVLGLSACGGGDAEAYCSTLEDSVEQMSEVDLNSPEALMGEGMDELVAMLDNAASDAPEEIADEHATVQELFEGFNEIDVEALLDVDTLADMDEDVLAELEALEQRFQDVEEDGERWGDWVDENCDIQDPFA